MSVRKRSTVVMPLIKPRPLINIGATVDIPTGTLVTGAKGESIVNGGLASIVGFIGRGNMFKSTIKHFFILTAADRMEAGLPNYGFIHTYDTENNMSLNIGRYEHLANYVFKYLPQDPIANGVWSIVSKADKSANLWVKDVLYPLVEEKKEDKDGVVVYNCFRDPVTKKPLELYYPTFTGIDSFSELEPESTEDMLSKVDIEKTQTMFMQQGLYKTKILKDLPKISNQSNMYMAITAHLGNKIDMSGPYNKPTKSLQYIKQDEAIKGVSDKLNFLTTHLWKAFGTVAMINQTTKAPEYPKFDNDNKTDLNLVKLQQMRSKTGSTGYILELVVSQNDGVLPSLTELHYLKTNKFGLDGNPRSYALYIYPEGNMSRTTAREKIDNDPKLRRALTITTELHQLSVYHPSMKSKLCDAKTLYEDLKKLGYDWDILLNTRGWWTIDNYTPRLIPFLSTVDLLNMRVGTYKPFWLDDDKKPKKEFKKHFEKGKEEDDKK